MIRKILQKLYLALIFIILYAPIVTLMVLPLTSPKQGRNGEDLL